MQLSRRDAALAFLKFVAEDEASGPVVEMEARTSKVLSETVVSTVDDSSRISNPGIPVLKRLDLEPSQSPSLAIKNNCVIIATPSGTPLSFFSMVPYQDAKVKIKKQRTTTKYSMNPYLFIHLI